MKEIEGVVKYRLDQGPGALPPAAQTAALRRWFAICRARGLIGQDSRRYTGLAYGNISQRAAAGFIISGTQTGGLSALDDADLAWVTGFDLAANRVEATGPARPSSEALTHALVYHTLPRVHAVIHVHSPAIWQHAGALGLASTPADAAYGTVAMAQETAALLRRAGASLPGLFVMGGHEDGVVAYGADMDSAGSLLLDTQARAEALHAACAGDPT
jgi:ribulose-5-phosphate 4-epimerase/fuculose-1-phosphate aldolase